MICSCGGIGRHASLRNWSDEGTGSSPVRSTKRKRDDSMYFITTIRLNDEGIDDQRPVGYFKDYYEAKLRVEGNSCDIFEAGYYKYAAIVKIEEGLYPDTSEIHWFEYCKITDNVIEVKDPNLKHKDNQKFRPYILG